ncbi:MAG: branched-chain amino acid ABC transporter permease, partial [Alphaproteobacteria bacterium]
MDAALLLAQALNGLQLGVLLFLMAAGLTLVFGIMNLINLAHGSLYMAGAYLAAAAYAHTGSFVAATAIAVAGTAQRGAIVEVVALSTLNPRDHLDHVLATFGLILVIKDAA